MDALWGPSPAPSLPCCGQGRAAAVAGAATAVPDGLQWGGRSQLVRCALLRLVSGAAALIIGHCEAAPEFWTPLAARHTRSGASCLPSWVWALELPAQTSPDEIKQLCSLKYA